MPIDEIALNTLLADDLDFPTAYAASIDDAPASRSAGTNRRYFDFGLIVGLIVCIVWLLWQ